MVKAMFWKGRMFPIYLNKVGGSSQQCSTALSLRLQSQYRVRPGSVIGARPNGPSDDSMNGDRENMICDVLEVGQDNGITVESEAQF